MNRLFAVTEHPVTSVAELNTLADRLLPDIGRGAAQRERDRLLPFEAVAQIAKAGLFTTRIPVRYGGSGGSVKDVIALLIRIASVDSNVAQALGRLPWLAPFLRRARRLRPPLPILSSRSPRRCDEGSQCARARSRPFCQRCAPQPKPGASVGTRAAPLQLGACCGCRRSCPNTLIWPPRIRRGWRPSPAK